MHTMLFVLSIGFVLGGIFYMYMYERHIKTSITKIRKENKRLINELELEKFWYSEEHEYANDLLDLLIKCKPHLMEDNKELYEEIEQRVKSASV